MQTYMRKNAHYGWQATTEIHMPAIADNAYLIVTTHKMAGGALVTMVTMVRKEGSFNVFVPFISYSERVFMNLVNRVTENAVKKQQNDALAIIDGYINKAIEYNQKTAA